MLSNIKVAPLRHLIGTIAAAVVAVALWRLFAGLGINSFWQDEIFSMRLAEKADFSAMMSSAVEDTHPPTFYALLWAWTHLFGFDEVSARLLPALCSMGLIIAILALPRREIGWLARVVVVMLVVTSPFWIEHADEVRSYAPVSLLLGVAALAASRLVAADGLQGQGGRRFFSILFLISATVAAASHLFAIYAVAWLCVCLVIARFECWKIAATGLGCAVLAGGAYLVQVSLFHNFESSGRLFAHGPDYLIGQVKIGLISGGYPALVAIGAIAVVAVFPGLMRNHAFRRADMAPIRFDLTLCFGPFAVTIAGLLVTMVVPSLNYRGPQVGLVLGWCGLIGLIDRALKDWPRAMGGVTLGLVAASAFVIITRQGLQPLPSRYDFRSMAQHLAGMPACDGAIIPVLRNVESEPKPGEIRQVEVRRFLAERFGYYDRRAQHDYRLFLLLGGRYHGALAPREVLAARISGRDQCPVLAIVADIRTYPPEALESAMRSAIRENGGDPARLETRWFLHYGHARANKPVRQLATFTIRPVK